MLQRNVLDYHVRLKTLLVTGTILQRKNESCILVTCYVDYIKVRMHIDTNINMCLYLYQYACVLAFPIIVHSVL